MKKIIVNGKEWNDTVAWLKTVGIVDSTLLENIEQGIQNGVLQVNFSHINPKKKEWDGEMVIDFLSPLSTQAVVNGFIQHAHADEISMDDGSLRLWWD